MSAEEQIIITFLEDGSVQMEVKGVKGPRCQELTRPLEEVLGGQVVEQTKKPEFYEHGTAADRLQQKR